jgi:hypothetical protein
MLRRVTAIGRLPLRRASRGIVLALPPPQAGMEVTV